MTRFDLPRIARCAVTRRVGGAAGVLLAFALLFACPLVARAQTYLGRLGGSPYSADSTSNRFGIHGSPYGAQSIQNPYSRWGSPYGQHGVRNPYTMGGPRIVAEDGTYLGRLNANRYDPESVSNPYGRYGSRYSAESIHNPYGRYGSPYSAQSPNNRFTTTPPILLGE